MDGIRSQAARRRLVAVIAVAAGTLGAGLPARAQPALAQPEAARGPAPTGGKRDVDGLGVAVNRAAEAPAAGDAAARWQAWERCEESRQRLERCPRGTGARKRLRDDCAMSDRIARLHDPGYPRCLEPDVPRP